MIHLTKYFTSLYYNSNVKFLKKKFTAHIYRDKRYETIKRAEDKLKILSIF